MTGDRGRRRSTPILLRRDRRYLLCGRDGCLEWLGDVDPDVWDPELTGSWVQVARLRGTGWLQDADGVWIVESHARARVRRGRGPAGAHPRVATAIEFDHPVAGHPYAMDLVEEFGRLPPDANVLLVRGRPRSSLRPGERVRCGKCGAVNQVDELVLAPAEDALARLRDAGPME